MALNISTRQDRQAEARAGGLAADRRLYVTRDRGRVVEDGDPEAGFLLASGPGALIPPEDVARLGLTVRDGRIVQHGGEKEQAKPADKQAAPPADKMIVKPSSKRKRTKGRK